MLELIACAILIAPLAWACRRFRARFDPWAAGLAALFALFQAVGHAYEAHGTYRAIFSDPSEAGYAVATLLVCGACFYFGLALLFLAFDRAGAKAASREAAGSGPAVPLLSDARFFLAVAAVFLAAWLPYLTVFAPGSFTYDGTNQMDVFYGFLPRTDHHPYFMTLLMGSFFDVGRQLGSDNLGVALWVWFQTFVQAAAFSASVCSMRRMGAPRGALVATVAYFALVPAWGAYAQAFLKDTFFASLFCLYVTLLAETWLRNRRGRPFSPGLLAALGLLCLALCLSRHNGAYAVALSLPFFAASLTGLRARLQAGGALLAALVAFFLASSAVLPALGVEPAGRQESFGALFQQTARYLKESPEDVAEEERSAIQAVLDYDALPSVYEPYKSDNVKATYTGDEGALPAYLQAWASMGLRHPGIYLDAFLAGMYGYVHVGTSCPHDTWDYRFYTYGPLPGVPDDFQVGYVFGEGVRGAVIDACNAWQGIPLLGLTGHCGIYAWAVLVACGYLLRARRARLLFLAVPALAMLLICFVSPVNGYVRYMLPVMAVVPLTLWFAVREGAAGGISAHCRTVGTVVRRTKGRARKETSS